MKLTVKSHFYDGAPNGTREEITGHLVTSTYLVEDPILKIIINHDADLQCCGSTAETVSFHFSEDDPWQGWTETSVTITGETPEEIDRIKMNQFRQTEKGQIVVAFLPWNHYDNEKVIASWEQPVIDEADIPDK